MHIMYMRLTKLINEYKMEENKGRFAHLNLLKF